jgi:hypothetical protein
MGSIGSVVVAGGGTSGASIMGGLATIGLGSALLGIAGAAALGYAAVKTTEYAYNHFSEEDEE